MDSDLTNKIEELKKAYYQNNQKCVLFKNKQKNECASTITNIIDTDTLFRNTIYTIGQSNQLYFDYTVFKTYMNNSIVNDVLDYTIKLMQKLIQTYGSFVFHVNMDTYSITAHERYKHIYSLFFESCTKRDVDFNHHVSYVYVYNSPKILITLSPFFSSFLGRSVVQNVKMYSKTESKTLLHKLFTP